jgi:hypothetical protein
VGLIDEKTESRKSRDATLSLYILYVANLPFGCCTVGWVDFGLFYILNKSTAEICYIPSKSTENNKKFFFLPSDLFIIGHDYTV